jgi:predicted ferric reductase
VSASSASFGSTLPAKRRARRQPPARPVPPPPHPVVVRGALLLAGTGFGVTTGLAVIDETRGEFTAPGGQATFLGSLTGMAGTYLALIMVLLVSRIPVIERVLGQDGLLRWHRRLAPWPISLIASHALFITIGYAQAAKAGIWHETGALLTRYPDVLIATVALGIMCAIGVVSIRAIRRRLRRETWWLVHLYMYLALSLSFAHELALGPSFVGHPLTRVAWSVAWAGTAGVVLCYRFGLPLVRSLRYRLVVAEVREEGPGVVSVICSGRRLERLAVAGGQFFFWRFLTRGMWWQAHPYSMSALPRPPYLRLTVKAAGDHSASLAKLRPGTRVVVEGPYGVFTRQARRQHRAALIAAGIGVTALRSLLEDLPPGAAPVVVLRASSEADLVLRKEVADLVRHQRGQLHELAGGRAQAGLDEATLPRLIPDLHRRDVFVCGPESFVTSVAEVVKRLGVPDESIHHEAYAL